MLKKLLPFLMLIIGLLGGAWGMKYYLHEKQEHYHEEKAAQKLAFEIPASWKDCNDWIKAYQQNETCIMGIDTINLEIPQNDPSNDSIVSVPLDFWYFDMSSITVLQQQINKTYNKKMKSLLIYPAIKTSVLNGDTINYFTPVLAGTYIDDNQSEYLAKLDFLAEYARPCPPKCGPAKTKEGESLGN